MIKVLFVITKNDIGGAQKYVKDLIDNLDSKKFEIKILTGKDRNRYTQIGFLSQNTQIYAEGTKADTRLLDARIDVKNNSKFISVLSKAQNQYSSISIIKSRFLSNAFRPYFLFINDIAAIIELFFIFRQEKPDIIHLNSSKAGVIGSFAAKLYNLSLKAKSYKLKKAKIIFTVHGWVFNPNNDLSFLRRKFYIWLHKIAAHFQDKIINVSEYDRQLALKHKIALPEKLVTIYNGIDYKNLKFLDKINARKALYKKLYPAPDIFNFNYKWIGSVGRLVPEKDYETFVEIASLISNAYFFIIGSGPEYKNLKAKSEKLKVNDRVFIIENISPAVPYFKAFDIFVLSSIKEGLPYTLLEAMAAQLPIVVTRVGGMTEIIEGRGLVMPPKEPEELARAINYFLTNENIAKELSEKACEFLKNQLTLEKMVEQTEKIYLTC